MEANYSNETHRPLSPCPPPAPLASSTKEKTKWNLLLTTALPLSSPNPEEAPRASILNISQSLLEAAPWTYLWRILFLMGSQLLTFEERNAVSLLATMVTRLSIIDVSTLPIRLS